MAESYASSVVPDSAEAAWRVLRDFGGLARWHPVVASCALDDNRQPTEVGCVRSFSLKDGSEFQERLLALDDTNRTCSYEYVRSPLPVRAYLATIRVSPVTDTGYAFVEWHARYDAESADEPSLDRTIREGVFEVGLRALATYLGH